jgi:hypothetical protein
MPEPQGRGWGPVLGAAGACILAGLLVCFAPFARCPACRPAGLEPFASCLCGGKGRVSIKAKWDFRRAGSPRGP